MMNTRQLGLDGPSLTVLGFGAWAIGGPWIYGWGQVNDAESIRAIHRALDGGINWIDTAAAYGLGHSEEIVARAIRGQRQKVFVATKCGLVPDGQGDVTRNSRPESIRSELEESLRRLETDCVDLYQIHWHDDEVPVEESWGAMVRLKEEGKTRFIGVSNYTVPLLERCLAIAPVQSLQPPYSMVNRGIEEAILPFCLSHGIGVIVYSPMQSGLLTGRYNPDALAADDWRRRQSYFVRPEVSNVLRFVDQLRPLANNHHATVGQLAVAWVLQHHAVTGAIVGSRTTAQVDENLGAVGIELTNGELEHMEQLMRESQS
jgi:aryl-alcohol dehydrogenase-like predicted oxidoreductase